MNQSLCNLLFALTDNELNKLGIYYIWKDYHWYKGHKNFYSQVQDYFMNLARSDKENFIINYGFIGMGINYERDSSILKGEYI